MQNLPYLFATYAIVWLVLFGYLFVVAAQVRAVRRDLDQLKERVGVSPAPPEPGNVLPREAAGSARPTTRAAGGATPRGEGT
jgi:CcmD family protein